MKQVQSALNAIYRFLLTGTEVVHAGPLFTMLHLGRTDFWGLIVFASLLKLFLFLNDVGIIRIRNTRAKQVMSVAKYLVLTGLWLLISLFDIEDGHWRSVADTWPALIAVGILFITNESVLFTGETIVEDYTDPKHALNVGIPNDETSEMHNLLRQFAQLRRIVLVTLGLVVFILLLLLHKSLPIADVIPYLPVR